jgi:hypothetical protein
MVQTVTIRGQYVEVPSAPWNERPMNGLKYGALTLLALGIMTAVGLVIAGHLMPKGNPFEALANTISYTDLGIIAGAAAAAGVIGYCVSKGIKRLVGDEEKKPMEASPPPKKPCYLQVIEKDKVTYVAKHIFERGKAQLVSVARIGAEGKIETQEDRWDARGYTPDLLTASEAFTFLERHRC